MNLLKEQSKEREAVSEGETTKLRSELNFYKSEASLAAHEIQVLRESAASKVCSPSVDDFSCQTDHLEVESVDLEVHRAIVSERDRLLGENNSLRKKL